MKSRAGSGCLHPLRIARVCASTWVPSPPSPDRATPHLRDCPPDRTRGHSKSWPALLRNSHGPEPAGCQVRLVDPQVVGAESIEQVVRIHIATGDSDCGELGGGRRLRHGGAGELAFEFWLGKVLQP